MSESELKKNRLAVSAKEEIWPLARPFRISRGTRTEAQVVVVEISDGTHIGRGESVPARRYDQTIESVLAQIESVKSNLTLDRQALASLLPPGAARNAIDCALWDLEAKISARRAWELANVAVTPEVETAFTVSLDSAEAMGCAAKESAHLPLLKLKLGGEEADLGRVQAVRKAAPRARIIIDANESWSPAHFEQVAPALRDLGVELIEQPFPEADDAVLETLEHPVPVCADESCHTSADLAQLRGRYEIVNIKLDKTGGLSEALVLAERAREAGFRIFVGCMIGTSLGMAPARLLASGADYVDLDGPLWLARDREPAIVYRESRMGLPSPELWG